MRILILGTRETLGVYDSDYYIKLNTLLSGIVERQGDGDVSQVYLDDLYIGIGDGQFIIRTLPDNQDISTFDIIFLRGQKFRNYRDVVKVVSYYAHLRGVAVVNDYRQNRDGSKLAQATEFYEAKLPIPYTVLVTPALLDAPAQTIGIDFPCIMKSTLGARGEDNYVVRSVAEIAHIQSEKAEIRFILQRMIPNDGDYRLLLIGDNYIIIKRTAKNGSHLNNTSQGGIAELQPLCALPATIIAGAQRLARELLLTTAGVDVLADKNTGDYYFLEVNSQPQLVSGAFLEAKRDLLAAYLQEVRRQSEKPQQP